MFRLRYIHIIEERTEGIKLDREALGLTGLIILGMISLYFKQYELGSACIGAIAGYIARPGETTS